ncbi:hypothetical protein CNYM01_09998 [Colletotrichum nymphaeae SA-01]|uniref:Uncharacterized protein n=1 Tax=Colletotrichum nymphaeae SA-01 TaxID=1460502 RepID=A0A135TDY9_9PEZI|nr:hypothetical protein CNYM01_09998 [Colletotrichum nymphaeae SA-01]
MLSLYASSLFLPPQSFRRTYAAGNLQHVRDKLGADRGTTLVLLVLSSVREASCVYLQSASALSQQCDIPIDRSEGRLTDDGGDSAGRRGSAGVDHDEKLHQSVVDVTGLAGLDDEDILVADALANGDTVEKSALQATQRPEPAGVQEIVR